MQPHLAEGQLIDILREKDEQIVNMEREIEEKKKNEETLRENIKSLENELKTYANIVEVKDRSIVKLSNDLHEFDLTQKIEQSTPCPKSGVFVFYEKVSVGTQTEQEKQKDTLQDTVTAFLMQNKFLNKQTI